MKIGDKQNYLEFMFEENEGVIEYECEMILNNEIEGLLAVTKKLYNGKVCLMYNTREKVSIKRMEEGGKISVQDFITVCSSLLGAVCSLREYSLYSGGIVLDREYIFADPRTMRCSVIYLPNADKDMAQEELQQFFRELLFSGTVKIEDGSIVNKIVETLNKQFKDAGSLKKELEAFKEGAEKHSAAQAVSTDRPEKQAEAIGKPQGGREEKVEHIEKKIEGIPEKTAAGKAVRPKSPFTTKETKQEGRKEKEGREEKGEKQEKDRSGTVMLLITGVLAVGIAFLYNNVFFMGESGELDTSMLAGIFVAALGIEFLAYKKLKGTKGGSPNKTGRKPKKEKKQKKDKKEKPLKAKPSFRKKEQEEPAYREMVPAGEPAVEHIVPRQIEPEVQPFVNKESINQPTPMPYDNMTEYMDEEGSGSWGRAYIENAMGERYYLTLEHTRIGKQSDKAEIVLKNAKISRLHAEIYRKEGCYFLMDMNSSNGTYLNHSPERIIPCAEYELFSGYVIRFANEEYIFRMEQ